MSDRLLAQIATRAFETPLLLHPRKAEVVASVLAERIGTFSPIVDLAQARAEVAASRAGRAGMLDRFDGEARGPEVKNVYGDTFVQTRYLYRDGVALVTVEGSLVNRGAWIGADSGLTSYEGVMAQLASAAADNDVGTILLDLESPGGEAIGAFEMADFVRSLAKEKPIVAVVNGMAASAAYAMASGATRIVTTRSGISGSIGVVMLHLDRSKQMDRQGVKPTLIYAGGHKVDGNPFEPLPEAVRSDLQAEVDGLYAMFVETVAVGRGMKADAVRATQARTFIGQDAVDAGLADDVGTLGDLFADLAARHRAQGYSTKGFAMPDITQAAHEAAVATAVTAALAKAGEASKVALAADRARVNAILAHDESKGRETLAHKLAFETDMTVEASVDMLKAAPKAAAPAAADAARKPRLVVDDPKLAADAPVGAETPDAAWGAIVADMNARAGVKAPSAL